MITQTTSMALAAVLLLTGCDKPKPAAPAADDKSEARRAAEASIRATAHDPDAVAFRGEQAYKQAARNQVAVCGQVNVFDDGRQSYVPFVAVVTRDDATSDPARRLHSEAHVASTTAEASRTYVETVAHCYDNGGPPPGLPAGAPSVPPMPQDMRRVQETVAAAASGPPARLGAVAASGSGAAAAASGRVITRQNVDLHAAPHGDTVRVLPKGSSLRVFAEAPGGWLQVGEDSPFGWVHSSMVTRD